MRTDLKGKKSGTDACLIAIQPYYLLYMLTCFPSHAHVDLGYGDRYKFVVQVLIGEKKDQGVRMGTKCFWDAGTDNQATENFMNVRRMKGLGLMCLLFAVYVHIMLTLYACLCVLSYRMRYLRWQQHTLYICTKEKHV